MSVLSAMQFIAVVQRFITLQVAFNERMTDAWREYIQVCCTQLGPHDQGSNESVAQWWQAHSALAAQLDSLKILAADKVIEDIERRQRNSLPPGLRPRQSGDRSKHSRNDSVQIDELDMLFSSIITIYWPV